MVQLFWSSSLGPETHWNWFTIKGPDAEDFLQRLTTVHVKALAVNQGKPGCLLSPQGKLKSYFYLWKINSDEYAFEFDAGAGNNWKKTLFETLEQYHFGENFQISSEDLEGQCVWIFFDALEISLKPGETKEANGVRLCHHGQQTYGQPWITAWGSTERLRAWVQQYGAAPPLVSFATLEEWRIQAVQPRVDYEILETSQPLEIGLHETISDSKGCYPGQEIIEKIRSLGAPARRLVQLEGEGTVPQRGDKILSCQNAQKTEIGEITSFFRKTPSQQSAAPTGGLPFTDQVTPATDSVEKFCALGWVKKIYAKEGLCVEFLGRQNSFATLTQVAPYRSA